MKWFLTGDSAGLANLLEEAGEEVISTPGMYRVSIDDDFEAVEYNLAAFVRSVGKFDVLVLNKPWELPGYHKRTPLSWGGMIRGRCVAGVSLSDPDAFNIATNTWRGCNMRPAQFSVYMSNDINTLNRFVTGGNKGVLWDGDIHPFIKACKDTCEYVKREYRIYKNERGE